MRQRGLDPESTNRPADKANFEKIPERKTTAI
jgi:hypothetical protein